MMPDNNLLAEAIFLLDAPVPSPAYAYAACLLLTNTHTDTIVFKLVQNSCFAKDAGHGSTSCAAAMTGIYTYDATGHSIPAPRNSVGTTYTPSMHYYSYRYYSPSLGRWLSRDPVGETGGNNVYGFVGNDPADRRDPFGLEFGITYVQFEGLLGHGWIRTGEFQTYDITSMFAKTITYQGISYKVNSATATLPVGIGFYPSVEVTPLQALLGVPGEWRFEQQKELVAVNASNMLKQWDTELKSRRWLVTQDIFKYGIAKGKCCRNATKEDVIGCIMDYKDKHPRVTYSLPFLSCRSRAKDALHACCLNVGDSIPTTVGDVRIQVTPTGGTP